MVDNACAIVGHCSNQLPWGCDENNYLCCRLKKILKQEIEKMIKQGVNTFYVGGEDGIDLIAAEMILALKTRFPAIRLIIVLAYEGMTQDWTEDIWQRMFRVVEKCDENVLLSNQYIKTSQKQWGIYIADHAEHLIAIWDMQYRACRTFQTMLLAKIRKRNIIVIDPTSGKIEAVRYHK